MKCIVQPRLTGEGFRWIEEGKELWEIIFYTNKMSSICIVPRKPNKRQIYQAKKMAIDAFNRLKT